MKCKAKRGIQTGTQDKPQGIMRAQLKQAIAIPELNVVEVARQDARQHCHLHGERNSSGKKVRRLHAAA